MAHAALWVTASLVHTVLSAAETQVQKVLEGVWPYPAASPMLLPDSLQLGHEGKPWRVLPGQHPCLCGQTAGLKLSAKSLVSEHTSY